MLISESRQITDSQRKSPRLSDSVKIVVLRHRPSGDSPCTRNSSKIGQRPASRTLRHYWLSATCDAVVLARHHCTPGHRREMGTFVMSQGYTAARDRRKRPPCSKARTRSAPAAPSRKATVRTPCSTPARPAHAKRRRVMGAARPLHRRRGADRRMGGAPAHDRLRLRIFSALASSRAGPVCLAGDGGLIIATALWYPRGASLARYDFMFLAAVGIQVAMLAFKLETMRRRRSSWVYHVVGTIMVCSRPTSDRGSIRSRALPHRGVPLFSGFMYASIGSYIARAGGLFDFSFLHHPPLWTVYLLGSRSTPISTRTIT